MTTTKPATREVKWCYFFEGAKKVAKMAGTKGGAAWYEVCGGTKTGILVKNRRRYADVTTAARSAVVAALIPGTKSSSGNKQE